MHHHRSHPHRSYSHGCSRFGTPWQPSAINGGPPLPVADVDRIRDAGTALALFAALASHPPAHETLAVLLDAEHRGSVVVNVDGTVHNDSVLGVADLVTEMAHRADDIEAAIIASFRPGGSDELDDLDRWLTIDEQLSLVGIELVEWFVIGRSVSCPRSLFGDEARWVA